MAKRIVSIEIDDTIEIKDGADFAKWAALFGVPVGERGRKPKRELATAIRDYDGDSLPTTIVDTEYFSADMADSGPAGTSEYGVKLAALRSERDAAVKAAHAAFESARDALRTEYGVSSKASSKSTGVWEVSAYTPMLDKTTGEIMRTKPEGDKPGKVKFQPRVRKVQLTIDEVRQLTGTVGQRGRVSQSAHLHAAVVKGEWFPVDHMSVDGWDSVLLKNATVNAVADNAE